MSDTRMRQALNLLKSHGWLQLGATNEKFGTHCMHTAVCDAHENGKGAGLRGLCDDLRELSLMCAIEFPERIGLDRVAEQRIWDVNDHPATTLDDVERVMEKAAVNRESEV